MGRARIPANLERAVAKNRLDGTTGRQIADRIATTDRAITLGAAATKTG